VGLAGSADGAAVTGETDGSGVGFKGTDDGVGATVAVGKPVGSARQPTTDTREITQSDTAT
jgi:hypothetical protein